MVSDDMLQSDDVAGYYDAAADADGEAEAPGGDADAAFVDVVDVGYGGCYEAGECVS